MQFAEFEAARAEHGLKHWQHTFELHAAEGDVADNAITLVARGAPLPIAILQIRLELVHTLDAS